METKDCKMVQPAYVGGVMRGVGDIAPVPVEDIERLLALGVIAPHTDDTDTKKAKTDTGVDDTVPPADKAEYDALSKQTVKQLKPQMWQLANKAKALNLPTRPFANTQNKHTIIKGIIHFRKVLAHHDKGSA